MSTTKGQQIGIIIIAIVMTIGTIGSFFIIIVENGNNKRTQDAMQAQQDQAQKDQQKQFEEYQKQQDEIAAKLSPTYYPIFQKYESTPAPFDASKVKSLSTNDLEVGDGAEVKTTADLNMYYIGWNPTGKVFDGSIKDGALSAPLDPSIGIISGLTQGIVGMKIGGVREVTIPAALAYGEQSPSPDIPANTPLKFIILAIPPQK